MHNPRIIRFRALLALAGFAVLCGCATEGPSGAPPVATKAEAPARFLDRLTWGVDQTAMKDYTQEGQAEFLRESLHPKADPRLPPDIAQQISTMTITTEPLQTIVFDLEQRRRDADAIHDDDQKKAAQQAYQQELTRIGRESMARSLLRAVYSRNQLQEQMTWFWMNHFNVHIYKSNIRVLVGDYEERAIRPHALGRFRDLLEATVHHPAMLRYLDNEQNAAGHVNENYARELMELHTLGVNGGYSQHDVQELARILTGVGVNMTANKPNVRANLESQYVRQGLFEFNPMRHDYGDKQFLGHTIKGRGLPELEEALDILSRQPATARFVSQKLAVYFVSDNPPGQLVNAMAERFLATDGDIAATLQVMFESPQFAASLGTKFKDPMHYVISAVRLAYDDKPILNATPMINWLARMGEPLFSHETPDGYPMNEAAWASPGQMTTRFEIAKAIGSGSAGLFKTDGPQPIERAAFPQLSNALYFQSLQASLGPSTRHALDEANSAQEWNTFLLASPEFMHR